MKMNIRRRLQLVSFLILAALAGHANAELAVIAHPSVKLVGISKEELKEIYLGRARTLPNGAAVDPIDQSADSSARRQFIKDVLGMEESAVKSHWAKLVFTGKARPPQILSSDDEVKKAVAGNPDRIGYIQGKYLDPSVKALLILP